MKKLMWISTLAVLLATTAGARDRGRPEHDSSLNASDRQIARERAKETRRERKRELKRSQHHYVARRHRGK
jgi:hypothetical protein